MNQDTQDFTRKIRAQVDELESARSRFDNDGAAVNDTAVATARAWNVARDALETIEGYMRTQPTDE